VKPTTEIHVGGTSLVLASHTRIQQPTSASHVGELSITSMSHVEDKQPDTAGHVGGIDFVEKPRWIGCNPKFPCKLCKRHHLTHLCPGLP
jgi:hypothetical protein